MITGQGCWGLDAPVLIAALRTAWYQAFAERWITVQAWHRPMVLSEYRAARDAYIAGLHLGLWLSLCEARWAR